jgi:Ser/Thr protein kinase RdoA (MazF antagonist)
LRERRAYRDPDGWARFGRDLATLLDVPVAGCPFRRVSIAEFVSDHTERLLAVRPLLAEHLIREIEGAIAAVAESDRLVITHGDPGTGNYLDREDDNSPGILLDWETATVSPFGLDLARAIFISLLDLRHTGISAQLAPALISGYTERAAFTVSDALLRAWTTIAGLQFIHGRHLHPLRADRTPQIAAQTLSAYLDGPLLG